MVAFQYKKYVRLLFYTNMKLKSILQVMKALEAGVIRANKNAVSNAHKVQKFKLLPTDFSIHGGELGPTMKVKRNVVHEKYLDLIESFYD